ncbi:two-component system histidine kinase [Hydrogenimonas sp.]|nr:two-component system histidine kinase [Hydrogenimonas sp.]
MLKSNLKLSQIFYLNFILLLTGTLAFASLIIYYSIKEIEIKQYTNQLKSEIAYVRSRLEEGKSLGLAAKEMSEIMGRPLRVTLIAMDGRPLFDNEADVTRMENHANRPEVMEARRSGFATAVRYSETVGNDRIYAAKKIELNGEDAVLRLSVSLDSVMMDFTQLWLRIALVFLVAVVLGFIISRLIQRAIDAELGKVTEYLRVIAAKNYKADISAAFSAEFSAIAKLLKKLAKRLEKNEKKKRKYTAKLRLASRQRSEIISAISHEFKNPVAAVMGYTETLLDDENLPLSIRKKFLTRIEENTRRISEMIDRLSFATRLENSEITPNMSDFELNGVVQAAAHALMQKYHDRDVLVKADESVLIHADKTMMEMVIVNLIDNALKYSDSDVEVRIDSERLSVIDRGEGIEESEIDAVTKKFYRVQKHSWDNSMGLGLAIVKYILKLHNIEIEISSERGKGTTVSFRLPAVCGIINKSEVRSKQA